VGSKAFKAIASRSEIAYPPLSRIASKSNNAFLFKNELDLRYSIIDVNSITQNIGKFCFKNNHLDLGI